MWYVRVSKCAVYVCAHMYVNEVPLIRSPCYTTSENAGVARDLILSYFFLCLKRLDRLSCGTTLKKIFFSTI